MGAADDVIAHDDRPAATRAIHDARELDVRRVQARVVPTATQADAVDLGSGVGTADVAPARPHSLDMPTNRACRASWMECDGNEHHDGRQ